MDSPWIRDRNCFSARFKIDPERRAEFAAAFDALCAFAEPFYRRGCAFAFQGWARDPNEFVVFASWDEDVVRELRTTNEFQTHNQQMMDCASEPVIMEQFSGMNTDRSVFTTYPAGASRVHVPGATQRFTFL
ncbi:hypothetical protein BOO86_15990 [Mycobacterium sp. CBMA 234]|nr:hypothetical protein [Mycolicibacterium sp. CBMA 234]